MILATVKGVLLDVIVGASLVFMRLDNKFFTSGKLAPYFYKPWDAAALSTVRTCRNIFT